MNEIIDYKDKIILHGDLFKFNSDRTKLIEFGGPENILNVGPIADDMDIVSFWYDSHSKTWVSADSISYADALNQELYKVDLPVLMLQRGPALDDAVLNAYNENSIKNACGFQYVTEELSARLNGALAEMRIDGIIYEMDLKKLEVRQKDDPEKKFVFRSTAFYEPTEQYYNTQTKEPICLTPRMTEFPDHVVRFTFPPLRSLDPIGFCHFSDYPPTWLLGNRQWNPKSINLPWKALEQTNIPELVRRNQIEQEVQGQGNRADKRRMQSKGITKAKGSL